MAGAIPKQTQEDIVPPPPIALGYRLGGVLLAAPVAATVQVVLQGPFGVDLMVPESPGSSALEPLGLLATTWITLLVSALAWVGVAVLERVMGEEKGRRAWTLLALGVLVFSLLPVLALDLTASQQWGLVVLHAAVALILIPSMTAEGTPGVHGPTNLGEPPSAGDVGDDHHDDHAHDDHGHDDSAGHGHQGATPDHVDDEYAHAAPASDAHDDSAHDDALDH